MLSFVDRPQVIEVIGDPRKEEKALKLVYFFGTSEAIDEIIAKRRSDKSCHQLPHSDGVPFSNAYPVRVFYWVGVNGVSINQIDVQFDSRWSCFYSSNGRVGTCESCKGNFHRHFLSNVDCVDHQIRRYEKKRIISRLAKLEPCVLLDILSEEEVEEPDPFFEDDEN